jgi:hypothetical protein
MPRVKGYWFPAKRYGWGWGPPVTWQGWVVAIVWAAALVAGLYLLRHDANRLPLRLGYVSVMSVVLGFICYMTGEPPKWRSGDSPE